VDPTFSLQIGKGRDVIRLLYVYELWRSRGQVMNIKINEWVIWTTHVGLVYDIR